MYAFKDVRIRTQYFFFTYSDIIFCKMCDMWVNAVQVNSRSEKTLYVYTIYFFIIYTKYILVKKKKTLRIFVL